MKNKIFLIVIILIGLSSIIFPQQKFRSAIFLHRSVGENIYDNTYAGATTSVPDETNLYNIAHSYTGTDAVSMDEVLFPWNNSGNEWYEWRAVFDGTDPDDDIYQYINGTDYDIIIIKTCYTVGIARYWYDGPQDTINYPQAQNYYNYQWHIRHIVSKMAKYPNKFFVIWTPAMYTPANTPAGGYVLGDQFSYWMTDTLATGIDPTYGAFPANIHIYDYFHDIDSLTMLPLSLATAPDDNHPNARATELIAPLFVEKVFNAAILYEINYPLPVELSAFSATVIGSSIQLNWRTETEINNYGFDIERGKKLDAISGTWEKLGFANGNGNSNSPKRYSFEDKNVSAGKYSYRLKQIDNDGQFEYSEVVEVDFNPITTCLLEQNFPNPFNPSTKISWQSPVGSWQTLKIYDILGNELGALVNEYRPAGFYEIEFNPESSIAHSASGIYFYRLQSGDYVETKKMIFLK